MEKLNAMWKNHKVLVMGSLVGIFLLFIFILMSASRPPVAPPTPQVTDTDNAMKRQGTGMARPAVAPPEVSFSTWTGVEQKPNLPTTLKSYVFKQAYTLNEVKSFAQKLQAGDSLSQNNNVITTYSVTANGEDKTASFLIFNTSSGEFSYKSNKGVALSGAGTLQDKVYAFMRSAGWYDPTIKVTAQYRNKTKPGVIYLEAHREWVTTGSPILSSVGLLNVPEDQSLSKLTLQTQLTNTPPDANVYATTDNRDGSARLDDFNTITFAIDENTQSIIMIKNNIRPLSEATVSSPLLAYEEAVMKLQNKQYEFILTSPAGAGNVTDWNKIYPNNQAVAQNAVVTDSIVAYLEQPGAVPQDRLDPYYIFRGYAELDSGYRTNFVAAVPAIAPNIQGKSNSFSLVKAAYAQEDPAQKQGTFDFSTQPTLPPNLPVGSSVPENNSICRPSTAELAPVYESNGLQFGWGPYTVWKGEYRDDEAGYWYYIPAAGVTASVVESNLDSIINALLTQVSDADIRDSRDKIQYDIDHNLPGGGQVQQLQGVTNTPTPEFTVNTNPEGDTGQKQGTFDVPVTITTAPSTINPVTIAVNYNTGACPVRLTGGSPTVFVYGPVGSIYEIAPVKPLTYADPVRESGKWNVKVTGVNSLLVNGVNRPYVYYEYEKTPAAQPSTGWNIKKSDVQKWVQTVVSPALGLTSAEAARVAYEVNHAASSVDSESIFVGVIDQADVEKRLPLEVSPASTPVTRVHFYVGVADGAVAAPALSPIVRAESMILEFGSYSK